MGVPERPSTLLLIFSVLVFLLTDNDQVRFETDDLEKEWLWKVLFIQSYPRENMF